jgi:hypothetical protein
MKLFFHEDLSYLEKQVLQFSNFWHFLVCCSLFIWLLFSISWHVVALAAIYLPIGSMVKSLSPLVIYCSYSICKFAWSELVNSLYFSFLFIFVNLLHSSYFYRFYIIVHSTQLCTRLKICLVILSITHDILTSWQCCIDVLLRTQFLTKTRQWSDELWTEEHVFRSRTWISKEG